MIKPQTKVFEDYTQLNPQGNKRISAIKGW